MHIMHISKSYISCLFCRGTLTTAGSRGLGAIAMLLGSLLLDFVEIGSLLLNFGEMGSLLFNFVEIGRLRFQWCVHHTVSTVITICSQSCDQSSFLFLLLVWTVEWRTYINFHWYSNMRKFAKCNITRMKTWFGPPLNFASIAVACPKLWRMSHTF